MQRAERIVGSIVAAFLLFCPLAAPAQEAGAGSSGEETDARPGVEALVPGVVIVHRRGERAFCSGTMLTGRLLVTALHCVAEIGAEAPHPVSELRVGFGLSTTDPDLVWRDVSRIVLLTPEIPKTVEALRGQDVVLLELSAESESPVFGIPGQVPVPEPGAVLTLIGFGEDRFGLVGTRHSVEVTVSDQTEGGFTYSGGGCLGDSGGPILTGEGVLVGIASLGTTSLCTPNHQRIGQSLAPFSDAIIDTLLRPGNLN